MQKIHPIQIATMHDTVLYGSYSARFLLDETDPGIAADFYNRDALYRAN
ncbi:MAG TPA: hypothetical protein VGQ03_08265 [Nitrososphaera sp.]|nr:hypothetical protein [Nitrososphaera sp.]